MLRRILIGDNERVLVIRKRRFAEIRRGTPVRAYLLRPKRKSQPTRGAGVKRGLAAAFGKFDEYRLAKYDRASKIKLRDVLFLVHAKPKDDSQAALWKRLVDAATRARWIRPASRRSCKLFREMHSSG